MKRTKLFKRSKKSTFVSMTETCENPLVIDRVSGVFFVKQQLDIKEDLIIVMNRDPLLEKSNLVYTMSNHEMPNNYAILMSSTKTVLIIRSANEISRDLQQAMERYDDIIADKQLTWPKDLEVHLHHDNAAHPWGKMDCLGKKGVHSRETILEAYGDYVKIYSHFIRDKKTTLTEKLDIIFSALGILLPLQEPSYAYPDTLYYLNQSVKNQSLVDAIRKRFEALKSLYGE